MCGIVGGLHRQSNVVPTLLDCLADLEYRGYDAAGLAVLDGGVLKRLRSVGKVKMLRQKVDAAALQGHFGFAHTRWATHGAVSEDNTHPLVSHKGVAVVHNGIIYNHQALRAQLTEQGYVFASQTDTEVIVHLFDYYLEQGCSLLKACHQVRLRLEGSFAVLVLSQTDPDQLLAFCQDSPLVLGRGVHGLLLASDQRALAATCDEVCWLQSGMLVQVGQAQVCAFNQALESVPLVYQPSVLRADSVVLDPTYDSFMAQEMAAQPQVVTQVLAAYMSNQQLNLAALVGPYCQAFQAIEQIHIVGCGSSCHAGLLAKYWLEHEVGIPCMVDIASEYRLIRKPVMPNTLLLVISQSGETADTLAALHQAKSLDYKLMISLVNVMESSIARASDWALCSHAGAEIGVASTKAFLGQLIVLRLLSLVFLERAHRQDQMQRVLTSLSTLPQLVGVVLQQSAAINKLAQAVIGQAPLIFLGRGSCCPIALEGALKLKELAYIQVDGYPFGELKHGPLALIDAKALVFALIPNNDYVQRNLSNLQEVSARCGRLVLFAPRSIHIPATLPVLTMIALPEVSPEIEAILYTVPLQLLAYHVAKLLGHDVDQPRNLAKSVTVE
jgi:glutamine---fructose-6-phosphate transaminase (isomerizing)